MAGLQGTYERKKMEKAAIALILLTAAGCSSGAHVVFVGRDGIIRDAKTNTPCERAYSTYTKDYIADYYPDCGVKHEFISKPRH